MYICSNTLFFIMYTICATIVKELNYKKLLIVYVEIYTSIIYNMNKHYSEVLSFKS